MGLEGFNVHDLLQMRKTAEFDQGIAALGRITRFAITYQQEAKQLGFTAEQAERLYRAWWAATLNPARRTHESSTNDDSEPVDMDAAARNMAQMLWETYRAAVSMLQNVDEAMRITILTQDGMLGVFE